MDCGVETDWFSLGLCGVVIIGFIGFSIITVIKWSEKKFTYYGYPVLLLASSVSASVLILSDIFYYGILTGFSLIETGFAIMLLFVALFRKNSVKTIFADIVFVSIVSVVLAILKIMFPYLLNDGILHIEKSILILEMCLPIHWLAADINVHSDKQEIFHSFSKEMVIHRIDIFYFISIMLIQLLGIVLTGYKTVFSEILVFSLVSYILCIYAEIFHRLSTGEMMFVRKMAGARNAKSFLAMDFEDVEDEEGIDMEECYKEIYDKLEFYFKSERPYLNANLGIADAAKAIYTNKSYLSRSIRYFSGRNFCQYVNCFRIKYSVEAFIDDPTLNLTALAELSGFHSSTSFKNAFILYMNVSPGEWCKRIREISGESTVKK